MRPFASHTACSSEQLVVPFIVTVMSPIPLGDTVTPQRRPTPESRRQTLPVMAPSILMVAFRDRQPKPSGTWLKSKCIWKSVTPSCSAGVCGKVTVITSTSLITSTSFWSSRLTTDFSVSSAGVVTEKVSDSAPSPSRLRARTEYTYWVAAATLESVNAVSGLAVSSSMTDKDSASAPRNTL